MGSLGLGEGQGTWTGVGEGHRAEGTQRCGKEQDRDQGHGGDQLQDKVSPP